MRLKHSKYKNTGILFELLVHQITNDTLKGIDSPAIPLIKKYFTKSELGKEYKLYNSLLKSKILNETNANLFISEVLNNSKKLNRGSIKSQKYNLIKEIKNHYDLDSLFNIKINNYKILASIYTLIESYNSLEIINSNQIVDNKVNLLEHLTSKEINEEDVKEDILKEFNTYDKDLKILTYKILLEKFNTKYSNLNSRQKLILKEYINLSDSSIKIKEFYNKEIKYLKEEIIKESKNIQDKVIKIKIQEVLGFFKEITKNDKINNDNIVDLLQYSELLNEMKKSNKNV